MNQQQPRPLFDRDGRLVGHLHVDQQGNKVFRRPAPAQPRPPVGPNQVAERLGRVLPPVRRGGS